MILRDGILYSDLLADLPVVHGFTTRLRGNMGSSGIPTDPRLIAVRHRMFEELGIADRKHVQPKQVHSNHPIKAAAFAAGNEADASIADSSKYVLSVMTADCLPILLYHPDGVVAAIHGGWRGLQTEVVLRTLEQMPANPVAVIGPAIGGCCYEVSDELAQEFEQKWGAGVVDRTREKPHLNLPGLALLQLQSAGVEEIEVSHLCTHCHPDLFFSYRREGSCGRMMAFIALK